MSLSVWDYVRRRSRDAFLAGIQDALDLMEQQDQAQAIFAAAKVLRRKLQDAQGNGGNAPKPDNHPLFDKPAPQSPTAANGGQSQHSGPTPPAGNSLPQDNSQANGNQRRPPGRPRKETHG